MPLPTTSAHLSDLSTEMMIEQFGGLVESQFKKSSVMRMFVPVRPVLGTDTIVNNRVGRTQMLTFTPGVRPDANSTKFGRVTLTVDTLVGARDNRSLLNELQTHFNARAELAEDHGKEIGYFFDQAFLIQAIKGSRAAAPTDVNSIGAGKNLTLSTANDERDADKLYDGIASIIVAMEEQEIPTEELVVFVRPSEYDTLERHDKLISRDYSGHGGDFAMGVVNTIKGAKIYKTARIPTAAIDDHRLSNARNSNAYNLSAAEAKAVAVIMHPKSLLAGETVPLQSKIYFSDTEKQWFIDSWLAFGVTVNRPDVCGAVFKA